MLTNIQIYNTVLEVPGAVNVHVEEDFMMPEFKVAFYYMGEKKSFRIPFTAHEEDLAEKIRETLATQEKPDEIRVFLALPYDLFSKEENEKAVEKAKNIVNATLDRECVFITPKPDDDRIELVKNVVDCVGRADYICLPREDTENYSVYSRIYRGVLVACNKPHALYGYGDRTFIDISAVHLYGDFNNAIRRTRESITCDL